MFYRVAKKTFCSYHHDFAPRGANAKNVLLTGALDYARIIFYLYLGFKIGTHLPQFLIFGRRRHVNNPDYMLFSESEFEKKALLNK
jgi:hypothetical protein